MKCNEFLEKLDAYIDGELSDDQMRSMLGHARECENCDAELKNAQKLKDMLMGMDDNIVPPLEVQAGWRAIVRSESQISRLRRFYRVFGAAAAALVICVGCLAGFGLLNNKPGLPAKTNVKAAATTDGGFAYVAVDGEEDADNALKTASAKAAVGEMTASVRLISDDLSAASDAVRSIVTEYNGYVGTTSVSASTAYINVYIPAESMEGFIGSLDFAGEIESSRVSGEGGGMAGVTITIKAR